MNIGKLQQFAKILAPEDNIMGNHPDFAQMVNDARLCIMVLRLLEQHIISGYSLIVGDNFSSLAADENVFLSSSLIQWKKFYRTIFSMFFATHNQY